MMTRLTVSAATLIAALVAFGCGGDDPFVVPLPTEPAEATIFDLFGPFIERASAFDLATGPVVARTDVTSQWDIVYAITPAGAAGCFQGVATGQPVFLPRGCFEAFDASSGLLRSDRAFDEVVEASGNAADYVIDAAVPIDSGAVYVLRSRPDPALSVSCRQYAKLEVLSLQPATGAITFRYLWNPNCNLRSLSTGS